jgi:hypothetical protein
MRPFVLRVHGEAPDAVETLLDEGCGEGAAQAPPAGVRVNVEPAKAQGGGPVVWQGLVGQAADPKKRAALAHGEERPEDRRPGRDLRRQSVHVPPTLRRRGGAEGLEIIGKPVFEANDLHQPGEIIFSGRTTSSNSSFVT